MGWLTGTRPPIDWRTACVARLKPPETSCADDFSTFLSGIALSANAMAGSHSCRTYRTSSRPIVATAAQAVHARAVPAPTAIAINVDYTTSPISEHFGATLQLTSRP